MTGSHYFDSAPEAASARRAVYVALPDLNLKLTADAGVFAGSKLDPGTKILLHDAPPPRTAGPVLDLGCGYGPIALTWATRLKDTGTEVWAVDVNTRALELTALNASELGLENAVRTAQPDEVPEDVRFAAIYSNPPIRVGKAVLHEMLLRWLGRLAPDGSAFLVVQRNLGSDSLAAWLNDQGHPTERISSSNGFRVMEARPRLSDV
jgi:16S rRNA G1207 methylase RsmC